MKVILMILELLFAARAMVPVSGQVTKTDSEFDGTIQFRMEPAWACSGPDCSIKIGFYRTSRMESDSVVMIVSVVSSGFVAHPVFALGESLHFNVDGQIYSFESFGSYDKEHGVDQLVSYTVDLQKYSTTKDFLKTLLNARRVIVKIDLVEDKYVEGIFPDSGFRTVRPGLADFYQQAF